PPRGEVVERDAHLREAEERKVGVVTALGCEGDGLTVGRPLRLHVAVAVVGELPEIAALGAHYVEIGDPPTIPAEHESASVGRPARTGYPIERKLEAGELLPAGHVEYVEDVPPLAERGECEARTVGR